MKNETVKQIATFILNWFIMLTSPVWVLPVGLYYFVMTKDGHRQALGQEAIF